MDDALPAAWQPFVGDETAKPYYDKLQAFLTAERRAHAVYPPAPDVFTALRLTPYADVKVLILGQDPYHDEGQAHGLAFSVRPGVKPPPSLANIFRELRDEREHRGAIWIWPSAPLADDHDGAQLVPDLREGQLSAFCRVPVGSADGWVLSAIVAVGANFTYGVWGSLGRGSAARGVQHGA